MVYLQAYVYLADILIFSGLDTLLQWQKPGDLPVTMGLRFANVLHPLEF